MRNSLRCHPHTQRVIRRGCALAWFRQRYQQGGVRGMDLFFSGDRCSALAKGLRSRSFLLVGK